MRGSRQLLAASLGVALLGACTEIENPRTVSPAEPSVGVTRSVELQRNQFEDIPVPEGFEYITRGNRSFSYTGGGVRVARLLYWGRMTPEAVADFYRRTMPLLAYGWEPISDDPRADSPRLDFKKGDVSCSITITNSDQGTYLQIDLAGPA